MVEVTFQRDGRVKVFAMDGDETFSVTTTVNKIVGVVPHAMLSELRAKMAQFLEETASAERMKIVGRA